MSRTVQQTLVDHYQALEQKWTVSDRSIDYSRLVVPHGNSDESLHSWFRLKEAYSSQLLARLFKDASYEPTESFSVLDPFLGSGTTLLSAISMATDLEVSLRVAGIERNPLIYTVASAKTAAAISGSRLADEVEAAAQDVGRQYEKLLNANLALTTPSVTLNNGKYFPVEHRASLLRLARAIDAVSAGDVRDVLRTCLASSVEPSGKLRRDGRALRYVGERIPTDPVSTFKKSISNAVRDMRNTAPAAASSRSTVIHGDGRTPSRYFNEQFDWIVFSPPYPNNIDYTEVYKTEAWALDLYSSTDDMRAQRLSTVRSHPSVQFPDEYAYQDTEASEVIKNLTAPLLAAVPQDRYAGGRRQVILGYVDDMHSVLSSCRKIIKPSGHLVFVVGNSAHGSGDDKFVIAADLLMCALAECAGWTVDEIRVARWPSRRGGDHYLRESVVSLLPTPPRATNSLKHRGRP